MQIFSFVELLFLEIWPIVFFFIRDRNDITSIGEAGENIITELPPTPTTLHIHTMTGQRTHTTM